MCIQRDLSGSKPPLAFRCFIPWQGEGGCSVTWEDPSPASVPDPQVHVGGCPSSDPRAAPCGQQRQTRLLPPALDQPHKNGGGGCSAPRGQHRQTGTCRLSPRGPIRPPDPGYLHKIISSLFSKLQQATGSLGLGFPSCGGGGGGWSERDPGGRQPWGPVPGLSLTRDRAEAAAPRRTRTAGLCGFAARPLGEATFPDTLLRNGGGAAVCEPALELGGRVWPGTRRSWAPRFSGAGGLARWRKGQVKMGCTCPRGEQGR